MKTSITNSLFYSFISLALLYWFVESFLDTYIFNAHSTFFQSFLTQNSHELFIRFTFISLLFFFLRYIRDIEQKIKLKNEEIEEFKYLETTDPITSLFNKRKFYELLEYEIEKNNRYKSGLSIIFCRIDNYQTLNTSFSQERINELLRTVALQLAICLRKTDIISHWGEEDFLILIPNKTIDDCKIIAEKIRKSIEKDNFEKINHATVSIGITQLIENDNKVSIVNRANSALTNAVNSGGNKIETQVS